MHQIGLFFIMTLLVVPFSCASKVKKAKDIIQLIKDNVTCTWADQTVDTYKSGNPDDEVTGVISCMFADMAVLQEAVNMNCNLIIAHEPIFYSHLDETEALSNDPVYMEKQAFIDQHKLIVWRFHDHWHRTQPDGIYVGMLKKLKWNDKTINDTQSLIKIEEQSLGELVSYLQNIFQTDGIRVVGDPSMKVSKVGLAVGAPGAARQIGLLNDDVDVLIGGEVPEWETYQYVNDASLQKRKKAMILLGHINSEEAGMEYFAEWLLSLNPGVPVHFVANKIPYWSPNN